MRTSIAFLILLVASLIFIGSTVFLSIALVGAAIVPITWCWGALTGQSYARVCDNSEMVYQLNKVGQWTIVVLIAIAIVSLVIFI